MELFGSPILSDADSMRAPWWRPRTNELAAATINAAASLIDDSCPGTRNITTHSRPMMRSGRVHHPRHHHSMRGHWTPNCAVIGSPSSPSHHHLLPITRNHPSNTRIATGNRMRGKPPGKRLADLHRMTKTITPRAPHPTANTPGARRTRPQPHDP